MNTATQQGRQTKIKQLPIKKISRARVAGVAEPTRVFHSHNPPDQRAERVGFGCPAQGWTVGHCAGPPTQRLASSFSHTFVFMKLEIYCHTANDISFQIMPCQLLEVLPFRWCPQRLGKTTLGVTTLLFAPSLASLQRIAELAPALTLSMSTRGRSSHGQLQRATHTLRCNEYAAREAGLYVVARVVRTSIYNSQSGRSIHIPLFSTSFSSTSSLPSPPSSACDCGR